MRLMTASIAFPMLLAASLGGKGLSLKQTNSPPPGDDGVISYLEERGLTVHSTDARSTTIWTSATSGACQVRFTTVAPEGWSQTIVAEQTKGTDDHLTYAYDGRFYAQQPVLRTRFENYRRRVVRYFGFVEPDLQIRAIAVSSACPPKLFGPDAAQRLSR